MRIDHARHAPDLIPVPIQDRLEVLLRVVEDEPGALAEVRTFFLDISCQGMRYGYSAVLNKPWPEVWKCSQDCVRNLLGEDG